MTDSLSTAINKTKKQIYDWLEKNKDYRPRFAQWFPLPYTINPLNSIKPYLKDHQFIFIYSFGSETEPLQHMILVDWVTSESLELETRDGCSSFVLIRNTASIELIRNFFTLYYDQI